LPGDKTKQEWWKEYKINKATPNKTTKTEINHLKQVYYTTSKPQTTIEIQQLNNIHEAYNL